MTDDAGLRRVRARELLEIYRRRRDMRAKGTAVFSQELFEDIVSLVKRLETLPAEELCSLQTIKSKNGETLIIRAGGAQIGRLRLSAVDSSGESI